MVLEFSPHVRSRPAGSPRNSVRNQISYWRYSSRARQVSRFVSFLEYRAPKGEIVHLEGRTAERAGPATKTPTTSIVQLTNGCQSGTIRIAPSDAWGRLARETG